MTIGTVGIIGTGRIGGALARLLVAAGYRVTLANSRGPDSLGELLAELGPLASAATTEDVARSSDVVVLATRWDQVPVVARAVESWDGRIVIDATNNRFGPGPKDIVDLGDQGSSAVVAGLLPGARLVKAFNHQSFVALAESLGRAAGNPDGTDPYGLFVAGDDLAAKKLVEQLIRDLGGEPIDTGGLRDGGRLQGTGGPLAGRNLFPVTQARRLFDEARKQA